MEMGQWVMGSWVMVKWVTIFGWVTRVMGHSQWPTDPWWNNCAVACNFKYITYSDTIQRTLFLIDIKKLLTHSIRPIIIAGGLMLIYDFFALKTERVSQYHHATPPPWDEMINSHGSWVMGHERWPISISGAYCMAKYFLDCLHGLLGCLLHVLCLSLLVFDHSVWFHAVG